MKDSLHPLTHAQAGVWLHHQAADGAPIYLIPLAFRLCGPLDLSALRQSLSVLINRHDLLRAQIKEIDGQPQQLIRPRLEGELAVGRLAGSDCERSESEVRNLIEREVQLPMDLARGDLIRCGCARIRGEEHLFTLTLHHLIADARSLNIICRELSALYNDAAAGRVVGQRLEAPASAEACLEWDRECLAQITPEDGRFWRRLLSEPSEAAEYPTDRPRPARPSWRGDWHPAGMDRSLAAGVKELARSLGTTINLALLTALKTLLFRSAGPGDVTVGLPISARSAGVENGVGLFVNVLPVRTTLRGTATFIETLRSVQEIAVEVYARQRTPLVKVLDYFPGRTELAATWRRAVFQFISEPRPALEFDGVRAISIPVHSKTAKFELCFNLSAEADGTIGGEIEYSTDLYERESMRRLWDHYLGLLRAIVEQPNRPIEDYPIMSAAEAAQALANARDYASEYPRESSVAELFEQQSRARPEAVALRWRGGSLSYAALDAKGDKLAGLLRRLGAGMGDRIGICMERSADVVCAMLGILKAGGCYVPIDPQYPAERMALMARDAGARIILTNVDLPASMARDRETVRLDQLAWSSLDRGVSAVKERIPATAPAYVLYTSGSTGSPKGVVAPHRGIVRLVRNTNYIQIQPTDVLLQFAPITFDASTFEIWGGLLNGAAAAIFPPRFESLEQFGEILADEQVTVLWLTAGLFHEVVENHLERLRRLRALLAGGDVLSSKHVAKFVRRYPGIPLINGYGPTENTTFTCCYHAPSDWADDRPVPIGRPISNSYVYVLDGKLRPVPPGLPGELAAGGDGVALGYLNDAALTRERFIPDPVDPERGIVYRTGDIVRQRPDGNIEFIGRKDHQVKIRGFRIELEEVERALLRLEEIEAAAVVAEATASGTRGLSAYVVLAGGAVKEAEGIQARLRRELPEQMIPTRIAFLEKMPLTENGKIDRKALAQTSSQAELTAPALNPAEARLQEIWSEVLGRRGVGRYDNFFVIGGHSLLATRVISRVNQEFHSQLSLASLFEAPTIAELAARLERNDGLALPPIRRRNGSCGAPY